MSCKARHRQKLKHIPLLRLKLAVAVSLSPSPWKLKTSEKKNLIFLFFLLF
uniref:Uncharacterized protein n=1 Tax=Brassica oleracea TaxID=3712 RepID=A0A3P6CAM2_BRAOL|nr:unnamed protein product [Brassica oleracea]